MVGIWESDGQSWELAAPQSFPDEQTLHKLVEEAPEVLPLAGSPQLTVLGSEVQLGAGWVDLLAVESSGRLTVIEVKLARNSEARRAVVAQVLSYAAHLQGIHLSTLEQRVLGSHLAKNGFKSIADAVAYHDQGASLDRALFEESLSANLESGRFRLVLVLDEAPPELVTLVAYLESVADELLIDLVKVSMYEVGGRGVLLPQRVDAERAPAAGGATPLTSSRPAATTVGFGTFATSIDEAPPESRELLSRLCEWGRALEQGGLARMYNTQGMSRQTLVPRLLAEDVGLVTVWNDRGRGSISFWRSVFERRAPEALREIESRVPHEIGQETTIDDVDDALLELITAAYREASAG